MVASPTVLVGVDALGHAVLDRVTRSLSEDEPSVRYLRGPLDAIDGQLVGALEELLRAGRTAGDERQVRLDVYVFVEVNALGEGELAALCQRLVGVVSERYGVMFPPDLPPGQRNAALHLVAVVPALAGQPEAQQAVRRLAEVDAWARRAAHPMLARVWLLSRHTIAGTLSDDGLIASCASFAVASVEQRQAPQVSARLAHLEEEGRFGLLSVASLEVPEAGLRRYARERSAYDGLSTLVGRVTRQVSDPTVADQAVSVAEQNVWFVPFDEGDVAQRCRKLSAALSGAAPSLPNELPVGPFDDAARVRELYPALFRPATQERAPTGMDSTELEETLRALGRVEADAMASVARGMNTLLTGTLGPQSGLRRVSEVELGLRRLGAWLRDADAADRAGLEGALGPQPGQARASEGAAEADPHREELEQALAELPSPSLLRGAASAVGVGAASLALALLLRVLSPGPAVVAPVAPAPSMAPGTVTTGPTAGATRAAWQAPSGVQAAPWAGSAVVGVLGAVGWARFASDRARERLRRLLRLRRDTLEQHWSAGGGGRPRAQAEAQLQLRKRRVRKAAIAAVDQALLRMGAVTTTLIDQRDRAMQGLRELGVKSPSSSAAHDDLTGLLGERDALHDALVPPALLSAWVARRRQITDADLWADRLVEQTWPARGLNDDIPCADPARIDELCRWQITPFVEQSMLGDPEISQAAAQTVETFVRRAAAALAPPVIPRTDLGDPATGLRPGEVFAVAPQQGAPDLEIALQRSPFPLPVLWSTTRAARVLFLRTWEGYTLDDIARGARLPVAGGAR